MLSRNLYLFSMDFLSILFKLFILPFIDYCSSLFIHLENNIDKNRLYSVFSKSVNKILNINIHSSTPDIQLKLLKNFNILPLIFRYFQHFCIFSHSLFKFNSKLPLVTSILIFNSRQHIIQQPIRQKKYSFSIVSAKILSLFIYSRLSLSKLGFKNYINSNLIKLFNLCNHVWDLDVFY